MKAIEYRIIMGRNIGDKPMSDRKFERAISMLEKGISEIVLDESGTCVSGTTTYPAIGQWQGMYEESVIVCTIVPGPYIWRIDSEIRNVVRKVKKYAQQESILILRQEIDVEFV